MAMTRSRERSKEPPRPRTDHLVTETDEPVDSVFAEKQMRLLTAPLYSSWKPGRPFVAMANVGLFAAAKNPALVPDVLVSLDVSMPPSGGPESLRSYFAWELGKMPDVVIEIVSRTKGGKLSDKLRSYERIHVPHYVVFDPLRSLGDRELTTFSLDGDVYSERDEPRFPGLGLALTLWDGSFEGISARWLRWIDLDGGLVEAPEESRTRADALAARADALAARLRALGVDPDGV